MSIKIPKNNNLFSAKKLTYKHGLLLLNNLLYILQQKKAFILTRQILTLIKQASEDMVLQELSFNVLKLNIPNFQNPLINNIEWQHYKSV